MYSLWLRVAAVAAGISILGCSDASFDEGSEVTVEETAELLGGPDAVDPGPGLLVWPVDPARELVITHLSVVEDPVRTVYEDGIHGASSAIWTFGRLMEQLAGSPAAAPAFTLAWLEQWNQAQSINGFTALARPLIHEKVIDPWMAASGGVELDMKKAPFRLLAIVNRLDLRSHQNEKYSAGELRFVFGLVDELGEPLPFTVIFEYGVPVSSAGQVKAWAHKWHVLGKMPFGTAFNHVLQTLTSKITHAGCAPLNVNGSCLNQIRTNEAALSPIRRWELREFRLTNPGALKQVVAAQTPDASMNGTPELANFINTNQSAAAAKKLVVPPGLLAASAPAMLSGTWKALGVLNNEARHGFGISTCNGCHTTETGTHFLHVENRDAGVPAELSGFLTGITTPDPVTGAPRSFNALADRAADMQAILSGNPGSIFSE